MLSVVLCLARAVSASAARNPKRRKGCAESKRVFLVKHGANALLLHSNAGSCVDANSHSPVQQLGAELKALKGWRLS